MAKFQRDGYLEDITITEETLNLINDYLTEREDATNANPQDDKALLPTYVIRFDNRGYRLDDFSEIMNYYSQPVSVERVFFVLESNISSRTNNMQGDRFEVILDARNPNNSLVRVNSDDRDVADSVFHGLMDIINKYKNMHSLVRNTWSQLLLQVFGVTIGFAISLIVGFKISQYLSINNAFVLSFLFVLLIFSNVWGFVNQQILRLIRPVAKVTWRCSKHNFV